MRISPREPHVGKEMTGRLVAKRAYLFGSTFSFASTKRANRSVQASSFRKHLSMTRQIFGVIVAVWLVLAEFYVPPQRVWNFHPRHT
jgi:hypothetical protein